MAKRIISILLAAVLCFAGPVTDVLASAAPLPDTETGIKNYTVAKQTELESILLLRNEPRDGGDENLLPLNKDSDKVAVFGNGQRAPINGSSGSGTVTGAFTYTLIEGLSEIGASYDATLAAYYNEKGSTHGWDNSDKSKWGQSQSSGTGWSRSSPIAAPELKIDDGEVKGDGLVASAAATGANVAIVYLQRQVGTEEMDRASAPPQPSDWYLNPSEKTLLKQVTDKFDDVVIVINAAGAIDMTWLSFNWLSADSEYNDGGTIDAAEAAARAEKIRSIVWSYGAGSYHGLVMAELMYGAEDFSAKLADTITYEYEGHYTSDKFGGNQTYASNGVKNGFGGNGANYNTRWGENDPAIIYGDYVYTGYRYFDTFMGDVAGTENDPVMFEFGFGDSYNDYQFSDMSVAYDAPTESFNVTAKITNVSNNTSLPEGKEVMEVYLSAPNDGDLDQPYQILVGYDKTGKLARGESETVTVNVPVYYMASYDEAAASYILEEGDFYFRVGNSSRNTRIAGVVDVSEEITVEELENKLTLSSAGSDENQEEFDSIRLNSQTDGGKTLVNPNDAADIAACSHATLAQSDVTTTTAAYNTGYSTGTAPTDAAYTLQAVVDRTITVEDFVAQMTKDELAALLSGGAGTVSAVGGNPYRYYSDDSGVNLMDTASKPTTSSARVTGAGSSRNIQRLGIPSVTYADGSAGISISSSIAANLNYDANAGYARAAGIACTWNPELQAKWGEAIGDDMLATNVDIWLAPSLNLHRNPLNGRNTEYYSEDGMLTGFIASNVSKGVASRGVTVCLKHFAGNDQEQYRRGFYTNASVQAGTSKDAVNTISSERALRETTLRAFELPVRTGTVYTVMSAFNKINAQECAASGELLTDILRGEWGFEGYVVTDWGDYDDIAHAANEMRSGNDMIMSGRHERYSIPDQLYNGIVDEYDIENENPYGGRDDGLVSMADMQRNAKNVVTTIMHSPVAFKDGEYNTGNINGSSINYHVERDLSILTTKLPIALVGEDYTDYKVNPLLATGSEGTAYYKFSVANSSSDQLPTGLILQGDGTITGSPVAGTAGWYNITFQVEDSFGNASTKELPMEVSDVAITNDSIGDPRIGLEYYEKLNAAGGVGPYTFSVDTAKGNPLPGGLNLDETTGVISGTPDDPNEIGKAFNIVFIVTDSEGSTGTQVMTIELLNYVTMQIGSFTSPKVLAKGESIGYVGISLTRGNADTFSVTASGLPEGLGIYSMFNLFMGTVSENAQPGEYNAVFTVKVNGTDISVDIPFTFIVYDAGDDLAFISDTLPIAKRNENYSAMIPAIGGAGQKTFSLTEDSDRPNGLKLNGTTGEITWAPGASQYGLHKLVVKVSDEVTSITKTFWLMVDAGISMSPLSGTEFSLREGEAFEQQVTAAGYSTSVVYSISDKGDALPEGLTLSDTGLISGTPTEGGTFDIIVEASEVGGALSGAMAMYTLEVAAVEDVYTVVFDSRGGSRVESQTVKEGDKATEPQAPTRGGYTFGGWYTDEACANAWDFDNAVTSALTLYAKWTLMPDPDYTIEEEVWKDGTVVITTTNKKTGDKTISVEQPDGPVTTVDMPKGGEITAEINYKSFVNPKSVVTIPLETADWGTVAVIVGGDDSEEIVKRSVVIDGILYIPMGHTDGIVNVKIVQNAKEFEDAGEAKWAMDYISFVTAHELFRGTSATEFEPNTPMTRGMFATVLHRLEGEPEAGNNPFSDVESKQYYTDAVTWAAQAGVVEGVGDNKFEPQSNITREQLAVMLYRYAGAPETDGDLSKFVDGDKVSDWAEDAMRWALEQEIITGKPGNVAEPGSNATRAEVAAMLQRYIAATI